MKLIIKRDMLARLLDHVALVVDPKSSTTLARCVRLDAADGRLTVTAMGADGATSRVHTRLDDHLLTEGGLVADHGWLSSIVDVMPHTDMELSSTGTRLTLRAMGVVADLNLIDPSIWMEPAAVDTGRLVSIDAAEWSKRLAQASCGALRVRGIDLASITQRALLLHVEAGRLRITATDRQRAARTISPVDGDAAFDAVIPARSLPTPEEGRIRFGVTDNLLVVEGDGFRDTRPLLDVNPPDVQNALLRHYDEEGPAAVVTVDRIPLAACLKRLRVFAGKVTVPPLHARMDNGRLILDTSGAEGECEDRLDADLTGDGFNVWLNLTLTAEALDMFDGPVIRFTIGRSERIRDRGLLVDDPDDPAAVMLITRVMRAA